MAAPAPETNPKARTSITASIYGTFEVVIALPGSTPGPFSPRPRMAYSQADAVLALAETLKTHSILPDEFLTALGDATMSITQTHLLECDGRYFVFSRLPADSTMEVIVARLKDYYSGASKTHVGQAIPEAEEAIEASVMPMTFSNSGGQVRGASSASPVAKTAKVRKMTTIYGGGDSSSKSEQLAAAAAKLTPEMVSRGVVLVMGKNGPKLLNTAGGTTDEEEGDAMADAEASGEDYTPTAPHRSVPIAEVPEAPEGEAEPEPAPRPVPTIRTMSGVEAERSLRASSVDHHDQDDSNVQEIQALDRSLGAQLGVSHQTEEEPVRFAPVVIDAASESAVGEMTQADEVGGRRVKRQEVTKRDRGGERPKRPKA